MQHLSECSLPGSDTVGLPCALEGTEQRDTLATFVLGPQPQELPWQPRAVSCGRLRAAPRGGGPMGQLRWWLWLEMSHRASNYAFQASRPKIRVSCYKIYVVSNFSLQNTRSGDDVSDSCLEGAYFHLLFSGVSSIYWGSRFLFSGWIKNDMKMWP